MTHTPEHPSRRAFLGYSAGFGALALLPQSAHAELPVRTHANILILGAGAAGTSLANRLTRRLSGAHITIVDDRVQHWYQPGLTLVAAGLKPASYVITQTTDWLPASVILKPAKATEIDPERKTVRISSGEILRYDYLLLATGLVQDYSAITGFSLDMVGRDGIGALYAGPEYAARTWQAASRYADTGGVGLFTRPATEMKCAGAPIKHTFLIDDIACRRGTKGKTKICYMANNDSLFSVPIVSEKVRMLFGTREITPYYSHVLTAIDPGRRVAVFATKAGTQEIKYDYLHVIPPQRAPEVVRQSGLSWADRWTDQGWAEVDMHTLRHRRYPNIFAVGDIAGVPKGKTAASVKWQVPVVTEHLVAQIAHNTTDASYNGYTSCPMITRIGRAMLVEFDYKNNLVPSFPGVIAPLEELWISWMIKKVALKAAYNAMLRGHA